MGAGDRRRRRSRGTGAWWADALDWVVVDDDPDEFEIRPAPDQLPGLLFVRVPEPKTVKNRLHLDFRPDDQDAEVERLLALGATRADVGQGEQSWVVLGDPEGNEFCVLSSTASRAPRPNARTGCASHRDLPADEVPVRWFLGVTLLVLLSACSDGGEPEPFSVAGICHGGIMDLAGPEGGHPTPFEALVEKIKTRDELPDDPTLYDRLQEEDWQAWSTASRRMQSAHGSSSRTTATARASGQCPGTPMRS